MAAQSPLTDAVCEICEQFDALLLTADNRAPVGYDTECLFWGKYLYAQLLATRGWLGYPSWTSEAEH